MDQGVALATIFTAAGASIWGPLIQGLIQVLKQVPQFKSFIDGREKLLCFIFAGIFVALAFWAGITAVPPTSTLDVIGAFAAFLSWFAVGRLAMAAYDDFISKAKAEDPEPTGSRPTESILNSVGWTGPPGAQG